MLSVKLQLLFADIAIIAPKNVLEGAVFRAPYLRVWGSTVVLTLEIYADKALWQCFYL